MEELKLLQSKPRRRRNIDWRTTLECIRRHGNRVCIPSRSSRVVR